MSKIIGALLLILGVLALLGGLAAAGYGAMDERDNQDQLLRDPERSEVNEALLVYGATGAGAALVAILLGVVFLATGGHLSHAALRKEIRQAAAAGALPAPPVDRADARKGWAALGVFAVALTLAVALGLAIPALDGMAGGAGSPLSIDGGAGWVEIGRASFDGRVQYGASEPTGGSRTLDASDSQAEMDTPLATGRATLTMSWSAQGGGSSDLEIILEIQEGQAWREIGRSEGASPVEVDVTSPDLGRAHLRYRVFANEPASLVVEQEFAVEALFLSPT